MDLKLINLYQRGIFKVAKTKKKKKNTTFFLPRVRFFNAWSCYSADGRSRKTLNHFGCFSPRIKRWDELEKITASFSIENHAFNLKMF